MAAPASRTFALFWVFIYFFMFSFCLLGCSPASGDGQAFDPPSLKGKPAGKVLAFVMGFRTSYATETLGKSISVAATLLK